MQFDAVYCVSSIYSPLGPTNQIAGFFDQSDSRSQVT